ncbi:GNAT family N-acetyltransferase [Aeromicrobium stalagmiti]|uniref:GNAT family N-acetyltransferase n=1 Tax=Aeromicrobium stalagmiti TaxID=2738988 RepID=UPI0015685BD3|nr:GNAT family protein [Aeromicrobium stalagmiti]NRQ48397.1 GNAT family N-acetyltransferase [Aeromicrobium stalagmiti]
MPDFRATPELVGDHVHLRPITAADAPGILAAADDDAVFEWLLVDRPTTLSQAQSLIDHYLGRTDLVMWAQVDVASGELAGVTTYYEIDPELRTVAIGHTWLGSRFWRSGLNTEAKLLLLRRAFDDLGCVRVVWHTDIRNERSQDAIARLGAQREGVMRKHRIRRDGSWRDTVTFSMTDDEWPAARAALEGRLAR